MISETLVTNINKDGTKILPGDYDQLFDKHLTNEDAIFKKNGADLYLFGIGLTCPEFAINK